MLKIQVRRKICGEEPHLAMSQDLILADIDSRCLVEIKDILSENHRYKLLRKPTWQDSHARFLPRFCTKPFEHAGL